MFFEELSPPAIWMSYSAPALGRVFDWLQNTADTKSGKTGESRVR